MVARCENELICDFAEVYGIYNYRALPARYVATLATGLRANSRTQMALSGNQLTIEEYMMATIIDQLSVIIWSKTKDASKGRNKPKSILEKLTKNNEITKFENAESFEKAREKILKGGI